jgi:hypothetical protein
MRKGIGILVLGLLSMPVAARAEVKQISAAAGGVL